MNHFIKKLSFFALLIASHSLYAAQLKDKDIPLFSDAPQIEVLDYTAAHNKINIIDHHADLQNPHHVNLTEHLKACYMMAQDKPMLAAVIMSDQKSCKKAKGAQLKDEQKEPEKEEQGHIDNTNMGPPKIVQPTYKKYLLDAQGLLNQKGHMVAHAFGYHIIQTKPAHIVATLLQWLQKSPAPYLYDIAFSAPICPKCQYLLTLLGYEGNQVKVHEKGCQAKLFPWPMPDLAMQQLNKIILNAGQPLEITQTILEKMVGISETSYNQLKDQLKNKNNELKNKENLLNQAQLQLKNKDSLLNETQLQLTNKDNLLNEKQLQLTNKDNLLNETQLKLTNKNNLLNEFQNQLNNKDNLLNKAQVKLNNQRILFDEVINKQRELTDELNQLKIELKKKDNTIKKNQKELEKLKGPMKYKVRALPQDLSGQNLSGYDFTGCRFTYTNLTDTNLTNAILTNTTCDYRKAFLDNIKNNQCYGGDWYQNKLPKDLKSIAEVYPKLNNNTDKVKLLQIASGLARLPFYESTEFYIKVQYWSSELWRLQQKLGNPYGQQLVCSLQEYLTDDANNYCWTTSYPQNKVTINAKAPHANFAQYLKDFTNGLTEYQCKSKDSWGFNWYKKEITKNIKGLKAAYPQIKDQQLQQEACHIAHALSKSYQIQQMLFLNHYLFFQNRLIRLKNSVGVVVKNKVHYNS